MNLPAVLALAETHRNANSSALACFADAEKANAEGKANSARFWALRSLAHSVGILHSDYKTAWKEAGFSEPVQMPVCYELACVTVHLEDGTSYKTNVNAGCTDISIRSYFVGQSFNVGAFPREVFKKCVNVEIER